MTLPPPAHTNPNPIYVSMTAGRGNIVADWVQPEVYPGGEIRIPGVPAGYNESIDFVMARLESAADIMALVLLSDILEQRDTRPTLAIPYFPYARQDRRSNDRSNESLSVKAFARLLSTLHFGRVIVCDPHSTVTPALIDRPIIVPRTVTVEPLFHELSALGIQPKDVVLVSPDAGALKETQAIAYDRGIKTVIIAHKERDPATGRIGNIQLFGPVEDLANRVLVIADDICDGGGTFVALAQALQPYRPAQIHLSVTHGIFSKGIDVLNDFNSVFSMFPFAHGLRTTPSKFSVGSARTVVTIPSVLDMLHARSNSFSNVYYTRKEVA